MRILLAYDGSPHAAKALALARNTAWPPDTSIRVVAVVESALIYTGPVPATAAVASQMEADVAAIADENVQEAVGQLSVEGRRVEGVVLRGRPASVLIDEAGRFEADLVMAGSRGRGPITRLLLGSVASEVVDNAPCPVLVTRTESVSSAVLAVDGSPASDAAEALVTTWPVFESVRVTVVSVAEVAEPWQFGIAPPSHHAAAAQHAEDVEKTKADHTRLAHDTAARLGAAGRDAEGVMRTGDAADEILAAATDGETDLIVMGSRGRTGLASVLLGSVARNVLHSASASVLIVRA